MNMEISIVSQTASRKVLEKGKNPVEKRQIYSFLGKRMQLVQSGSDRKRASRT